MGPFSNNPPTPPTPPNNGSRLPVPDVDGVPQPVVISPKQDDEGVKKWFTITAVIAGAMAVAGIVIFGIYVFISNTPNYMLSAAFQNFVTSDGQAGIISYESTGPVTSKVQGNFLSYNDPTNSHISTYTLSLGQDASRVSATMRLFADGNYLQTAGLGNLGRLTDAFHTKVPALTADNLVRLSSLDGTWYTLTSDDISQVDSIVPQHTVRSGPTSADVETIEQLYLKHPFIVVSQQLDDEHIDNINCMHIKVAVQPAQLLDFMQAVKAAHIKSFQINDKDLQSLQNSSLDGVSIDVWIARSDRTFEQIRLSRPNESLTLTFKSEQAAAQRQTILRPDNAKSMTGFIRSLHAVLSTKPAH